MDTLAWCKAGLRRIAALAGALCAALLLSHCSSAVMETDGPCVWTGTKYGRFVYTARQAIIAFAAPGNLEEARRVLPPQFKLAEPALARIVVNDLYGMEVGPPNYHDAEISLLVTHKGEVGWYIVILPVTDSEGCGGGVLKYGFPKIVRQVTLERNADHYRGVLYQKGGGTPEFALGLDLSDDALTNRQIELLERVSTAPFYTLKQGTVYRFSGYPARIDRLQQKLPSVFQIRFGHPTLEVQAQPGTFLQRLALQPPEVGFWLDMQHRYMNNPERL